MSIQMVFFEEKAPCINQRIDMCIKETEWCIHVLLTMCIALYRRIESQLKETGKITTGSKEEEPLSTVPGTCIIHVYQSFNFASTFKLMYMYLIQTYDDFNGNGKYSC